MQGPTSTHANRESTTDTTSADRGRPRSAVSPQTSQQSQQSQQSQLSQLLHDLNQPLSAITNYAQAGSHLIANGMADTERLKSLFEKIAQQSSRAAAISQDLRKAQDVAAETSSS
ncbi:MAG: histidine kinase dimerization/phospho-acceptor domain-containing protein [Gammaproteobacteria bacterium]